MEKVAQTDKKTRLKLKSLHNTVSYFTQKSITIIVCIVVCGKSFNILMRENHWRTTGEKFSIWREVRRGDWRR